MWIPEEKYKEARKIYNQTSSIDLTAQTLRESGQWQRAETNEAVERLKNELGHE